MQPIQQKDRACWPNLCVYGRPAHAKPHKSHETAAIDSVGMTVAGRSAYRLPVLIEHDWIRAFCHDVAKDQNRNEQHKNESKKIDQRRRFLAGWVVGNR